VSRGRKALLVTSALLLGGALVAVWYFGFRNVGEVAETIASGPVHVADGGAGPIRDRERMIFFCFDGVGHDALEEALEAGRLPHLRRVLGEPVGDADGLHDNGYSVPRMLSILPSTTVAAWSSVFTGVGVAQHGVSGNEQFHRETGRFIAPAPVTVDDVAQMMEAFNGGLVGELVQAETLYEKLPDLRSHASLAHVHRGADVFTLPAGLEALGIFSAFVEGATEGAHDATQIEGAKALDRESVDALLEAIDEHGLPDLQVVYFPGIDLFTHVSEDALEHQQNYLAEVTDPAIGRILDRWESEGELDRTWVVVTADHGHTPVLNDDRHSLGADPVDDDEPVDVLERAGFAMRPLEIGEAEGPYSAAVAYQGAFAYFYLADRSTCGEEACDWTRPPRLEEDVLVAARAFHEANQAGPLEAGIDLIFAREPRPTTEDALPFQVFDEGELVDVEAYLRAHPRPELLRLAARLEELAAGPYGHRAGDLLILSRSGGDRPIEERFYFSGPYRSWHGSPKESDSHIPLVIARRDLNGRQVRRRVLDALGTAQNDGNGIKWHSQREITPMLVTLLENEPTNRE